MTIVGSAVQNEFDVFICVKGIVDTLLGRSRAFTAVRPDVWKPAYPEAAQNDGQYGRRHHAEVESEADQATRRPQGVYLADVPTTFNARRQWMAVVAAHSHDLAELLHSPPGVRQLKPSCIPLCGVATPWESGIGKRFHVKEAFVRRREAFP